VTYRLTSAAYWPMTKKCRAQGNPPTALDGPAV
jgi:hypothetical protein